LMVPTGGTSKRVDIQGSVVFGYPGMTASVMYSKVADSRLRTEISGELGMISLDQVHIARQVGLTLRGEPTSGRSSGPATTDITVPGDADEYQCEFREFIDLFESGKRESRNNSLRNSLIVAQIMDEIRRQAGIIFPADLQE
ncbi:MAG: oxidoreductase, partial [Bacteroidales bacterium]|nr:oxidoreductase [Bacteroidales bacterium]